MRSPPPACRASNALPTPSSSARWSVLAGSNAGQRAGSPAASSSGLRPDAGSPKKRQTPLPATRPRAALPARPQRARAASRALLRGGAKGVMTTHDLGEAKRLAGEIVLMHRGRVIENGAADTFFADPRTEEARRFMRGELLV